MKTVTSTLTLVLAALALASLAFAGPELPDAKLLDMYAVKEGDSFVVHILADGDISEFLSDRKTGEGSYRLTLDIPALSPLDTKYDVETPFSRQFQVWPMQLGDKVYSRVQMELDTDAASVVGVENPSHLFVRIQHEGAVVAPPSTANASDVPATPSTREQPEPTESAARDVPEETVSALGVLPAEPPPTEDSDGVPPEVEPMSPADAPTTTGGDTAEVDEELFYNLFPTPAGDQQTLFNVSPVEDLVPNEPVAGIRVGRFALQPSVDVSYVRGSNLLLLSEDTFEDRALMVRGRVAAILLDSLNELQVTYEARYRQFEVFELEEQFTNFFDVDAKFLTTPNTSVRIRNHFVQGAFESQEFDPGGEIVANTDPFFRNRTEATFALELSERLGGELTGSFNRVEFTEADNAFFDYDDTSLGAAVLYNLTPLTSLVGEYSRIRTRPGPTRPEAEAQGDVVLFGLRGEVTPLLRGRIRVGYASQRFDQTLEPQEFRGLVADVRLTRQFGVATALDVTLGRRTNPSAYQENSFYVSNYATARFVVPLAEKLRLSTSGVFFANRYPLADISTGIDRDDKSLSGAIGVSYFFTPLSFLSVDYRHDRRSSNLERFSYRNNSVQLLVGFGFLNQ